MKKYGLIGYPLSHSFSPAYFAEKFAVEKISARYDLYPIREINQLCEVLDQEVVGLNVTIPYKEKVMPLLDSISPEAQSVGAVNTIEIVNGRTIGHNTDVYGFKQSLIGLYEGSICAPKALILGTGGAAKAVKYVLDEIGCEASFVSRSAGDLTYPELTEITIKNHHLIINTTPLGMHPHTDSKPDIPYNYLTSDHLLYDLVYNPEKTLFLSSGELQGARIKNGLEMLQLQADRAWQIWDSAR